MHSLSIGLTYSGAVVFTLITLVDTCQGAVNFLTGAEPLGALWALCGSEVEEAAMSATVIPLLTYDKLYPLGDLPERGKRNYGSRIPPLYSLSCVSCRFFLSWQSTCEVVDGVVLAEARCRPCLLLIFTPCAPLSTCLLPWFSSCSWCCP